MKSLARHFTRSCIAGIVALLPIGGTVLSVLYMEDMIAESWLADQPYYFPGMGLVAVVVVIYVLGLAISTFLGRWLFRFADSLLNRLPALGRLYQTLKEILGYGEGEDSVFLAVVLVPSRDLVGEELGLVTNETKDADGADKITVFVPGAPNPTAGRLLLMDPDQVKKIDMPVNEALKALVSIGKTSLVADGSEG